MRGFANKHRPKYLTGPKGPCGIAAIHGANIGKKIMEGNLEPALLFHGPKGLGKTTLARLVATTMNCESPTDEGPCWNCAACKEPDQGLYEINSGSRGKVDDTRDIIEDMSVAPAWGSQHKVYVFDEAHRMTTSAQDALLVPTEAGIEDVTCIMCTTEPNKIQPTLMSRAVKYEFQPAPPTDLYHYLCALYKRETSTDPNENVQKSIIAIESASKGCVRNAVIHLGDALATDTIENPAKVLDISKDIPAEDGGNDYALKLAQQLWGTQLVPPHEIYNLIRQALKCMDAEPLRMMLLNYGSKTILNAMDKKKRVCELSILTESVNEASSRERDSILVVKVMSIALGAI